MANIELKNIDKVYAGKTHVLKNINHTIKSGEFTVLLGPSGCGKSTLLNIIAGLEDVEGGSVLIDGVDVTDRPPKDRDIAMVFQSYALYPTKTVQGNMEFGLKMNGVEKSVRQKKVREVAELLQITDLLNRKPSQLSGGQRQRVAIGRALVRDAKVFLFDEPLSNLDAKLRAEMRTEIKLLHEKLGKTMIYVTHDQVEAMTMGTNIVVMNGGVIQQSDSSKNVYLQPKNLFVSGFLGSPPINKLVGTYVKGSGDNYFELYSDPDIKINLMNYKFENEPENGSKIVLAIRPENINDSDVTDSSVRFKLDLDVAEPLGYSALLKCRLGEQLIMSRVSYDFYEEIIGDKEIELTFDLDKILVFDAETENLLKRIQG